MEGSEKINGKKKLPSTPSNYVTLLQLQERWIKEKERKQKGKEEKEELQQEQEEKETKFEERVHDVVAGRGSRKNGHFRPYDRQNGKRIAEGKPREVEIAAGFAANEIEDVEKEKKGEELKNEKKKKKKKWKNKKEEKEEPQQEQEEKETKFEERVHDVAADRGSRKNAHFRPYDRENGKRVAEGKPRAVEIAASFAVNKREDVEKEKKGEELKNEKKKTKKKKWKNKRKEKDRSDNEVRELVGPAVNAPLPASIENNKGEEEVIGDEIHAPKLASVEEENVVAKTESQPRIIPRTDGRTVEIGRKFRAMSMKSEIGTGYYCRYGRQNGNFGHRGGNTELNRRYYGKFDRRREQNQRNEGMVWVKKGEVSDRNVNGIQSSSCSSKELD